MITAVTTGVLQVAGTTVADAARIVAIPVAMAIATAHSVSVEALGAGFGGLSSLLYSYF